MNFTPQTKSILFAVMLMFGTYAFSAYEGSIAARPVVEAQLQPVDPGSKKEVPEQPETSKKPAVEREGSMSLERMVVIIKKLDKEAKNPRPFIWQFKIAAVPVTLVTNKTHNRMRLLVAVRKADTLSAEDLMRISQANFDSALDARYAVGRKILWATYIHPMSTLYDRQFIAAIGQTVNLAKTFGTTYSSGMLAYQGGDSRAILRRKLIDKLLKKGTEI